MLRRQNDDFYTQRHLSQENGSCSSKVNNKSWKNKYEVMNLSRITKHKPTWHKHWYRSGVICFNFTELLGGLNPCVTWLWQWSDSHKSTSSSWCRSSGYRHIRAAEPRTVWIAWKVNTRLYLETAKDEVYASERFVLIAQCHGCRITTSSVFT